MALCVIKCSEASMKRTRSASVGLPCIMGALSSRGEYDMDSGHVEVVGFTI